MQKKASPLVRNFSANALWRPPEWYDSQHNEQLSHPPALHTLLQEAELMKGLAPRPDSQRDFSFRWMRLAKRSGLLHAVVDLAKASQPRPVDSENPTYYRYEKDGLLINWTPPTILQKLFGSLGQIQVITGTAANVTVQVDTSIRLIRPGRWISSVLSEVALIRKHDRNHTASPIYPPHF